jgi:hypothetical protein
MATARCEVLVVRSSPSALEDIVWEEGLGICDGDYDRFQKSTFKCSKSRSCAVFGSIESLGVDLNASRVIDAMQNLIGYGSRLDKLL